MPAAARLPQNYTATPPSFLHTALHAIHTSTTKAAPHQCAGTLKECRAPTTISQPPYVCLPGTKPKKPGRARLAKLGTPYGMHSTVVHME